MAKQSRPAPSSKGGKPNPGTKPDHRLQENDKKPKK